MTRKGRGKKITKKVISVKRQIETLIIKLKRGLVLPILKCAYHYWCLVGYTYGVITA